MDIKINNDQPPSPISEARYEQLTRENNKKYDAEKEKVQNAVKGAQKENPFTAKNVFGYTTENTSCYVDDKLRKSINRKKIEGYIPGWGMKRGFERYRQVTKDSPIRNSKEYKGFITASKVRAVVEMGSCGFLFIPIDGLVTAREEAKAHKARKK